MVNSYSIIPMLDNVSKFVDDKLQSTILHTNPFPYLYVSDFFPDDFYSKLECIFPDKKYLTNINDKSFKPLDPKAVPVHSRSTLTIFNREVGYTEIEGYPHKQQCIEFREWVSNFLVLKLAAKLQLNESNWDDDTRFVLDQSGYEKRPHTDHPKKVFSVLIYMSESKCGTTLLKPKQLGFSDDYGYDHRFDQFDEVFNAPFKPNTLIAFARTDTSFHCVRKLGQDEYRKAIHINIRN